MERQSLLSRAQRSEEQHAALRARAGKIEAEMRERQRERDLLHRRLDALTVKCEAAHAARGSADEANAALQSRLRALAEERDGAEARAASARTASAVSLLSRPRSIAV